MSKRIEDHSLFDRTANDAMWHAREALRKAGAVHDAVLAEFDRASEALAKARAGGNKDQIIAALERIVLNASKAIKQKNARMEALDQAAAAFILMIDDAVNPGRFHNAAGQPRPTFVWTLRGSLFLLLSGLDPIVGVEDILAVGAASGLGPERIDPVGPVLALAR